MQLARINLVLHDWLKKEAVRLAKEKQIGLSELIKDLLKEYVAKQNTNKSK